MKNNSNAARQAAWRKRRAEEGSTLRLVQAHLPADLVAGLDDYARRYQTNRVQLLQTWILEKLAEDPQEPLL